MCNWNYFDLWSVLSWATSNQRMADLFEETKTQSKQKFPVGPTFFLFWRLTCVNVSIKAIFLDFDWTEKFVTIMILEHLRQWYEVIVYPGCLHDFPTFSKVLFHLKAITDQHFNCLFRLSLVLEIVDIWESIFVTQCSLRRVACHTHVTWCLISHPTFVFLTLTLFAKHPHLNPMFTTSFVASETRKYY